jgi:hypothetical protein
MGARRASRTEQRQSFVRRLNQSASVASLGRDSQDIAILCECGRDDCETEVMLSGRAYRNIRRQGSWSVIVDGHELPEIDRVVQRRKAFTIVEMRLAEHP